MRRIFLAALLLLGLSFEALGQVSAPALINQRGTTTPSTCTIGQLFFDTNAAAGTNIYGCTAANVWTQMSGAGSGIAIGEAISGGTAGRVLFEGTGPVLADSASLVYDDSTKRLTVGASGDGWMMGKGSSTQAFLNNSALGFGGTTYALYQGSAGDTALNSASGQNLDIGSGNVVKMRIVSTAGAGPAITAGTATTDVNALNVTQTWNNGAVAFAAAKINVTNTASPSTARILDMQVAGTSVLGVDVLGRIMGSNSTYVYSVGGGPGHVFGSAAANYVTIPSSAGRGIDITAGTATTDVAALSVTQTWNSGATAFTGAIQANVTNTASAATAALLNLQIGGTTHLGYLPATTKMLIGGSGSPQIVWANGTPASNTNRFAFTTSDPSLSVGSGTSLSWTTGDPTATRDTNLSRVSAGVIGVGTGAAGSFAGTMQAAVYKVGGSAVTLADSNNLYVPAATGALNFGTTRSIVTSPADGVVTLLNNAQSDFGRLQFGGTTSSFPAIKRNAAAISFRKADDSADADVSAANYTAGANFVGASTSAFQWNGRGWIAASADGVFNLFDTNGTSFGRLTFGGTTSSFPSLKRVGANLYARLADDSAYTALVASDLYVNGTSLRFFDGSGQFGFSNGGNQIYLDPDDGRIHNNSTGIVLSSAALTTTTHAVGMGKMTASGSAPGAAGGKLELVCGTAGGSAKLQIYAGTSTTPVTIVDNIGSGVTGC